MIATRGFDLRGGNFDSFSPLFIHVQIIDNTVVRPADYIIGQLAQC